MGTCCSTATLNRVDLTHVDLQAVFERYIWKVLGPQNLGKCRMLRLRQKSYNVEIKWEYLDKICKTHFPGKEPTSKDVPVILHHAHFDNTSGNQQKFSFSTIKETKAVSTFSFSETYSIGEKYSLNVQIPGGSSLGAEITGNYSVTEGKSQTFETRIQWDMHSDITVEDKTSAEAEMQVHEQITTRPIIVTSKFTFAKPEDQRVPFVVRHKSSGRILFVGDIQVLKAPLEYFYEQRTKNGRMPPMLSFNEKPSNGVNERENRRDDIIIFKTSGLSKITSWKNHHITVNKTSDSTTQTNDQTIINNNVQDGQ